MTGQEFINFLKDYTNEKLDSINHNLIKRKNDLLDSIVNKYGSKETEEEIDYDNFIGEVQKVTFDLVNKNWSKIKTTTVDRYNLVTQKVSKTYVGTINKLAHHYESLMLLVELMENPFEPSPSSEEVIEINKLDESIDKQVLYFEELDQLKSKLDEAIEITQDSNQNLNYLIKAYNLTSALIEENIQTPSKIVDQINNIIDSYIYLTNISFKTERINETLQKVESTFPVIVDGLVKIYDSGLSQNLTNIEIESETLQDVLNISGLGKGNFEINKLK